MEEKIKYCQCSICGKRIFLEEVVLTKRYFCGIYCSPNCYAESFDIGACHTPLSEALAFRKDVLVQTEVI